MTEENCLQVDLERVIRDKNPSLARWLPRPLLSYLKRTIHQDEINRILKSYSHLDPIGFIRATLADMRIGYRSQGLDRLPADGAQRTNACPPTAATCSCRTTRSAAWTA